MGTEQKLEPGVTRIQILSAGREEDLGLGMYLGEEPIEGTDFSTPHLRLDSGQEILGCECWWIVV